MTSGGGGGSSAPPKESTGNNPTKKITNRFSLNCPIEHLLEAISTLQPYQITIIRPYPFQFS